MKRFIIAVLIATTPVAAHANCRTHTYLINGQYVMCTTCCYSGNCNTTCF